MERLHNDIVNRLYNEINMMVAVIGTDQTLIHANETLLAYSDVTLDDVVGVVAYELPWWRHSDDFKNKFVFAIEEAYMKEEDVRFSATHQKSDDAIEEVDFVIKPILEEGQIQYFLAMGYNITELVRTQKALTEREREIQAFFEYSNDGYFFMKLLGQAIVQEEIDNKETERILEALRISHHNQQLLQILGVTSFDHESLFDAIGITTDEFIKILGTLIKEGQYHFKTDIINELLDYQVYLDINLHAIYSEEGYLEGGFCIVRDVTTQTLYEERLEFLAKKDSLTGLNNRRNFFEVAGNLVDTNNTKDRLLTLAMMDIDHFKAVNDTYGHEVGDTVLKEVAERILKVTAAKNGVDGRYGGEEFILLLPYDANRTTEILDEFREELGAASISFGSGELSVTISIGIAEFAGDNLEKTISSADKALYQSKESGRNKLTIY